LRRGWAALAVVGVVVSALVPYRAAQRLGPAVERALGRALELPPGAVHVGRARLVPPATLRLDDLVAGTLTVGRLEVVADVWAALGGRLRVGALRARSVALADVTAAGVEAQLAPGRARVVARGLTATVDGVPLAVGELALEGADGQPRRAALSDGRIGPMPGLDGLAGSAWREASGRWAVRAARPGLVVSGHLDGGALALDANLERAPLAPLGAWLAPAGLEVTTAVASGALELGRDGQGPYLRGQLAIEDLCVDQPALVGRRLGGLSPTVAVDLRAAPGGLAVSALSVQLGPVALGFSGHVEPRRLEGQLVLGRVGCATLLRTLPRALLPALDGLTLDGTLAGRAALAVDRDHLDELRLEVDLDVGCRVLDDAPLADARPLKRTMALWRVDARGASRSFVLGPENPSWRPLAGLPAHVVDAFLEAEDSRFFHHRGFDLAMIRRALAADLEAGRFERGASTVTQQLAKNLFLSGERTLMRKLEEAVLAWRIEQVLDKRRILELYLNLVELGPGVYGVGEGAERYFGKEPDQLTAGEAAQLAALLPAPRRGMDDAWARRYQTLAQRIP
jgi:hypothetical protein